MSLSSYNPGFSGMDVKPGPKLLGLQDRMPMGKYKGETIESLIESKPDYVRWFVDTIDRYELDDEASALLNDVEESPAPKAADTVWFRDDDDIPY